MPIDVASAAGAELRPFELEYDERALILYALGAGAGADPDDLKFCYENPPGLVALPTFGAVPSLLTALSLLELEAVDVPPMMLLHGEQHLEIRKEPQVSGKLTTYPWVKGIFDKGKGALIQVEADTRDESGAVVYHNVLSTFVPGEGGFGGERGPAPGDEPPARAPDKIVEMETLAQQALLYRLSGEVSPLIHVEKEFATRSGCEKPILHGLCTFGHAGRAVLKEYCENEPARFKSMKVRFSGHVYPGETIVTELWDEGGGRIPFRVRTKERGSVVVSNAVAIVRG